MKGVVVAADAVDCSENRALRRRVLPSGLSPWLGLLGKAAVIGDWAPGRLGDLPVWAAGTSSTQHRQPIDRALCTDQTVPLRSNRAGRHGMNRVRSFLFQAVAGFAPGWEGGPSGRSGMVDARGLS